MPGVVSWLTAVLATLIGLGATLAGATALNALRGVAFTRKTAPGEVRKGLVEVAGEVDSAGDTFDAPLYGTPCVGYAAREQRPLVGNYVWRETRTASALAPFYLVDEEGRGRVLVKPAPFGDESGPTKWPGDTPEGFFSEIELRRDDRRRFSAGERPPQAVVDLFGDVDAPRRYAEWRIEPGDEVYVIGSATADGEPAVVNRGTFIVAELPQWRVALNRLLRVLIAAGVAVVMFAFAADLVGLA